MGKGKGWFILVWLICWGYSGFSQSLLRDKLVNVAESQIGVKEQTGKNDGKEVEMYLKSVKLGKGYAWCAAFMTWCHNEAEIDNPKSAWSPDWFKTNVVYEKTKPTIKEFQSKPGQVFGLYYEKLGRIGHVGMIVSEDKLHYRTIEGNTGSDGGREGDGVYRKIRSKKLISKISDYVVN